MPITDRSLESLARNHHQLVKIDVQCTPITGVGLKHLASLPNLTQLLVYNCQITDAGVKSLAQLTQLRELSLGWCEHITDEGIKELSALKESVLSLPLRHGRY